LSVNGGGFINTSRAIFTTGSPVMDSSGNLTGFNVTGGQITVQGSGLNATNTDQVELLARGSFAASGNTMVNAGLQLSNSGGPITAGQTVTESATTLDTSSGTTQAAQPWRNATNLVNHAGTITQKGI
jgi:filamentous hemagglutinin